MQLLGPEKKTFSGDDVSFGAFSNLMGDIHPCSLWLLPSEDCYAKLAISSILAVLHNQ